MIRVLVAVLLLGVLLAVLSGCGGSEDPAAERSAATTTPEVEQKKPKPPSFADMIEEVRSGVVRIETESCDGVGTGTGILIGDRLVATVEHVVDGATSITLKQAGKSLGTATVVGEDRARDLALLRTSVPIKGYRFKLAEQAPRLGEDVAALGYPLGLPFSVTRGSVSGSDRSIPIDGVTRRKLIQTDAAVSPGNSGGPLLVPGSKEVVGLVDLDATTADGIALAVSAEVARPLLEAWSVAPQPVSLASCDSSASEGYEAAPPTPAPEPEPKTESSDYTTFHGEYFEIAHPVDWYIDTAEVSKGSYLDTTIRDPADQDRMLRVDVTLDASTDDPVREAAPVVAALRRQSGYREIAYERTSFGDYDALYWEFEVIESGRLLHKVDLIFIDEYDQGVAILTQAPADEWAEWASSFAEIRDSLTLPG
jgi:hypothetical protein